MLVWMLLGVVLILNVWCILISSHSGLYAKPKPPFYKREGKKTNQMPDPEFTEKFNVEAERWVAYRRFIDKLRELLRERYSHNRGVLPVEVNPPTRFFDIVLETSEQSVTFRLRRDNLYLVGYQTQGSWFELRYDNDNPHNRIPNATFLGFADTYPALLGQASGNVPNQPNLEFRDISAGRQELINAINTLGANKTTGNVDERNRVRAKAIIVILVMIVESLRFEKIAAYFSGHIGSQSARIPGEFELFVRGWVTLSESLLHRDADATFRLPAINNFLYYIFSFLEAVEFIGLIKGKDFPPKSLLLSAADDDPAGRPLVELFSVKIDFIHENPNYFISYIYGKVQVRDGLGDEYVYNIHTNGFESIRPGETLSLNGPPRCITAYDSFTIAVTLMSREGLSEDDEISKGNILWEVSNISDNQYDKLLFHEVEGRFGLATLCYAVLRDAVQAFVEVTLTKNISSDSVSVYGLLTSHNASLNNESVLFHKKSDRFTTVKVRELIPLSKLVVAVPLNSNFIIRADLKGSNIFSSDDEIALGTATFSPQNSGTNEKTISGKNGEIRVKVIWAWYVQ